MTKAWSSKGAVMKEWLDLALVFGGGVFTGSATAMRATIVLERGGELK